MASGTSTAPSLADRGGYPQLTTDGVAGLAPPILGSVTKQLAAQYASAAARASREQRRHEAHRVRHPVPGASMRQHKGR